MTFFTHFKTGFLIAATGAAVSVAASGSAMAQSCPDWQLGGVPITTDAETAWAPQQYAMFAGGGVDLSQCSAFQAYGRVTAQPSFSISYDARSMGRDLEFRVQSECDTTLLINDSTAQWHYNDDEDGTLSPRLRLSAAATGRYDVWVGTYGEQACQATLVLETFPPSGGMPTTPTQPATPVCPDWQLGGAEVNLTAGSSDTRSVVAGGSINLRESQCNVPGGGYVAQAPDFTLYYDPQGTDATLNVSVDGTCDTTLLINDQSAQWLFDDDTNALQPALSIASAPAGRYDIWVGTYGASTCQSNISFSAAAPTPVQPTSPSK
ncbi:hypothetical protein [Pararhodobacter zhoushanensis]|uniref:hypothetical protein n=1 Tax=Pararhodobacter zhoushanensis TaxID=2479545 RepID=UPI000F8D57E8|nr:hypothetical protein [Pararhodobacter zhoushanensis]